MDTIAPAEKRKIIGLIAALMPDVKVYLFGTRARGTHSSISDIDLAIDGGEKLALSAIDEAKSILAASNVVYRVDVVDFNRIPEDMRSVILQEGILWKH